MIPADDLQCAMGIPATAVVIITCLTILAEVQTEEEPFDTGMVH